MGKSKSIESMEEQNAKFQAYLKQISADLVAKSDVQVQKLTTNINDYYASNKWTSEKFIAGENFDFTQSSEWSLERVKGVVKAISDAVFGGTPAPDTTEVTKTQDVSDALAAMASLQTYLASRVVVALTGILESFGNSNSIKFQTQYKSEALGNGFHLFTVMACDAYDSQGYFQNQKILEYLYAYEIRFSNGEAQSHAKIALVDALTNAIQALGTKIKAATTKWVNGDISDEQYPTLLDTYKSIQDQLTKQLADLSQSNPTALKALVSVPLMDID